MGETSETNITITELYKLYFHYHYGGNIVNQHYNNRVVQIIFSLSLWGKHRKPTLQ